MKTVGVILMAGQSTRFESAENKLIANLHGKKVFSYSVDAFLNSKEIDQVLIVTNNALKPIISKYSHKIAIILGGNTRQESVENALKSLSLNDDDIVIIHDAARPLVDEEIIKQVKDAAANNGASTTYIPETDTIAIFSASKETDSFVDRNTVAKIQTPQGFKFGLLNEAHIKARTNEATDDCSLVSSLGYKVKLVLGNKKLTKITTKEDILYLEGLLK